MYIYMYTDGIRTDNIHTENVITFCTYYMYIYMYTRPIMG